MTTPIGNTPEKCLMLLELARKATPGPWIVVEGDDSAFIACADPTTVQEICWRLLELEKIKLELTALLGCVQDKNDRQFETIRKLEAENEKLTFRAIHSEFKKQKLEDALDKWAAREASVCQEDVSFEETIKALKAANAELVVVLEHAIREIEREAKDRGITAKLVIAGTAIHEALAKARKVGG